MDSFSDDPPITAYIDMEFGAVHGTHQRINIPIEIGTLIYNPKSDEIDLSGKKFSYDLDVEQWGNVTDAKGRTKGVKTRVINLEKPDSPKTYDKKFHLDNAGWKNAYEISRHIHYTLNGYMQHMLKRNIKIIVFYAKQRELQVFERSKVDISNIVVHDLQEEIKNCYDLQHLMSLDRLSHIIEFRLSNQKICSENYSYTIPEKFHYLVKPHKAIGDTARMFMISKEFYHHTDELRKKIKPVVPPVSNTTKENQKLNNSQ